MNFIRKMFLPLVCLLIFAVFAAGCGSSGADAADRTEIRKVELTQRQMDILAVWGLSTDYDKLTIGQQSAIMAVEDMMSHIESKYDKHFDFVEYTLVNGSFPEELRVCEDGNIMFPITVTRKAVNGEIVYYDNYDMVQLIPEFMEEMDALVGAVCGGKPYVLSPEPTQLTASDAANALLACSSRNVILVSEADYDKAGMEALLADIVAEASAQGLDRSTVFEIVLLPADAFASANMFNYHEILSENLSAPHAVDFVH